MKSLLQTKQWTDLKVSQGWLSHEIEGIFVLEKKLPFGKSFLYAPEVDWNQIQNLQIFLTKIQKILENNPAIFFRLEILDEIPPAGGEKIVEKLKQNGFIKAFEEVQPEHRQIIDISKSENEILAQMKPKGRYNIKIAQKHNVVVEKSNNLSDFYQIFRETAKRDRFEIRPQKYFKDLMQILEPEGLAELWLAKYHGQIIAAVIVVFYNKVATYLYGASKNEFRNLMAPYLLHWRLMQRAKEKGCQVYDLLAVGPEDGGQKTENGSHKYAGITRFKEQFGGRKVHLVGSWDYVYQPTWYKIFKMAETFRRK